MSKFVSFWAQFRNGTSFHGNMILPDFDIQNNEDIKVQENVIKAVCNRDIDHHDRDMKVEFVTLTNWKAL